MDVIDLHGNNAIVVCPEEGPPFRGNKMNIIKPLLLLG
jgi:hypothetical protein